MATVSHGLGLTLGRLTPRQGVLLLAAVVLAVEVCTRVQRLIKFSLVAAVVAVTFDLLCDLGAALIDLGDALLVWGRVLIC